MLADVFQAQAVRPLLPMPGFVPLFNGTNLDGWEVPKGKAMQFVVTDDVVQIAGDPGWLLRAVQLAPDAAAERPFLPAASTLTDRLLLADRGSPSVLYFEASRRQLRSVEVYNDFIYRRNPRQPLRSSLSPGG